MWCHLFIFLKHTYTCCIFRWVKFEAIHTHAAEAAQSVVTHLFVAGTGIMITFILVWDQTPRDVDEEREMEQRLIVITNRLGGP